jgi:hypothetical protein
MATTTLVDNIFEEGKSFLEYLDKQNLDIRVAFWLYQKENNSWKLILSTPKVESLGSRFFYSKILRYLKSFNFQHMSNSSISPLDIFVSSYSDNFINLLKSMIKTSPAPEISSIRFSNNVVNGTLIDDVLVYRLA